MSDIDDGSSKPLGYRTDDGELEVRDYVDRAGFTGRGYCETELGQHMRWMRQASDLFEKYQQVCSERDALLSCGFEQATAAKYEPWCVTQTNLRRDGCTGRGRPSCSTAECFYGVVSCQGCGHFKGVGSQCNVCTLVKAAEAEGICTAHPDAEHEWRCVLCDEYHESEMATVALDEYERGKREALAGYRAVLETIADGGCTCKGYYRCGHCVDRLVTIAREALDGLPVPVCPRCLTDCRAEPCWDKFQGVKFKETT